MQKAPPASLMVSKRPVLTITDLEKPASGSRNLLDQIRDSVDSS